MVSELSEKQGLVTEIEIPKYIEPKKNISIWKILFTFYGIYVLIIISLANVIRTTQRNFINNTSVPIQRDLKISDTLFGLSAGPLFSLSHAVFGLVFGRM